MWEDLNLGVKCWDERSFAAVLCCNCILTECIVTVLYNQPLMDEETQGISSYTLSWKAQQLQSDLPCYLKIAIM